MNIRFFLRKSNKEPKAIWYDITWQSNRLKKSLKLKCHSKDWIERNKKGIVQRTKDAEINFIINDFELKVTRIFNDFRYNGIIAPSIEQVKNKIEGKEGKKQVDFFSVYDEFLEDHQYKVTSRGKILAENSLQNYRSFRNTLKTFIKETGYNLDFHTCDLNFYGKYRAWRLKHVSPNTFSSKDIKLLKSFLNWAALRDYPVRSVYRRFERTYVQPEVKPLSEDRLLELWNEPEQKNLDIFLFLVSTCMHISDYLRFAKEGKDWFAEVFFQGQKKTVIHYRRQKTGKDCFVPFEDNLHFRPVHIYNKYEGNLPIISGQKLNKWLQRHIGKDVTSKTGRKTGATQWIRNGMSMEAVMKIGGWTTEQALRSYLGFSIEDLLRESNSKSKYLKVV